MTTHHHLQPRLRISEAILLLPYTLSSSSNVVRVVISTRMRWTGHVVRMGDIRGLYRVFVGKPEGKNHLGDRDVDGRIILRWLFRKWDLRAWSGSMLLRTGTGDGHL